MLRPVYFGLGILMVALGIVGAFVPLVPTTSFLILAAWCFARSSRRAEAWILSHPKFGPPIVAWREDGAIARGHKVLSIGGMAIGFILFSATVHPTWWLAVAVAAALTGCSAYVASRPDKIPPGSMKRVKGG